MVSGGWSASTRACPRLRPERALQDLYRPEHGDGGPSERENRERVPAYVDRGDRQLELTISAYSHLRVVLRVIDGSR